MSAPTDAGSRRLVPVLLGAALAAVVLLAGAAVWLSASGTKVVHAAVTEQVPTPVLMARTPSGPRAAAPWDAPLVLHVADGTFREVSAVDPDGAAFDGSTTDPSTWTSAAASLLPDATYRVTATVADQAGAPQTLTLTVHTTPATRIVHAMLNPGDDSVVGVGMPIAVVLDHPVERAADRTALVSRLSVVTSPAVQGAWRWLDSTELHYRGPTFWKAGTTIRMTADLRRLHLSGGTWGSGVRRTSYRIGDELISTVDVTKHLMTVRRNGVVLRVAKVSTGRDKYPTKGGVHIVLEKANPQIMDSETVGIPRKSPDGYYEKVPFSVRISNGGAFVHSADWSVRDQGVRNVSHGCVNMSPSDAAWFYGLAKRGDVVTVIHSAVAPVLWDAGMADWNIPFDQWAN